MTQISVAEREIEVDSLLDALTAGAVALQRQDHLAAILVSAAEYELIRNLELAEFLQLCNRLSDRATALGMTDADFNELAADAN